MHLIWRIAEIFSQSGFNLAAGEKSFNLAVLKISQIWWLNLKRMKPQKLQTFQKLV